MVRHGFDSPVSAKKPLVGPVKTVPGSALARFGVPLILHRPLQRCNSMPESTHCDLSGRSATDPLDDGIEMRPRIDGSTALIIATAPKALTSNWWTFMRDTAVDGMQHSCTMVLVDTLVLSSPP